MTYLLRLVLPDRPGSLGAVATALGGTGVDIESLDVVERGPFGAVDDLVVTLPAGGLADSLLTAARSVPGVEVESVRPFHRAHEMTRDLDIVDALAASPPDALARLAELAPEAFHASWALLLHADADGAPAVTAASTAAPAERDLDASWLPLASARRFGPDEPWVPYSWFERGTELAAAPGRRHRVGPAARADRRPAISRVGGGAPRAPRRPGCIGCRCGRGARRRLIRYRLTCYRLTCYRLTC